MCYRCRLCNGLVPPKTACKRIVRTRMFQHPFRPKVQKKLGIDKMGKWKIEWMDDAGGIGPQIVSETPVCATCEAKYK